MKLMSALTMGITGLATLGLLSLTNLSAGAQTDYAKRDEDPVDLVLVDDDDDDDTNDDTTGDTSANTGNSASTNDNTASNFTAVSRDRDHTATTRPRLDPRRHRRPDARLVGQQDQRPVPQRHPLTDPG